MASIEFTKEEFAELLDFAFLGSSHKSEDHRNWKALQNSIAYKLEQRLYQEAEKFDCGHLVKMHPEFGDMLELAHADDLGMKYLAGGF